MDHLRRIEFCLWQAVNGRVMDKWVGAQERANGMNDDGIRQQLEMLKVEHRDLDAAITALQEQALSDQLQIARLKRKKLGLKDRIRALEDQLVPDIIA
jgi:hypothetical protein